jgi:hypothetical protein
MHAGGDSVVSLSYEIMDVALYHPHARQIGKELNGMMATQKAISGMFPLASGFSRYRVVSQLPRGKHLWRKRRARPSAMSRKRQNGQNQHFTLSEWRKHLLSDALLARIEQAIAELDYRPSLMARNLKHGAPPDWSHYCRYHQPYSVMC